MRRHFILLAASSLALAAAAGPALSQSVQPISVGASVEGTIGEGDSAAEDYRYDAYRFRARAGQRLEATMRAPDFDAYLEVFAEGDDDEALASDDDGLGNGTNSRLRFTPERDGTYVLRARPLSGLEEGGSYTLRLAERPPAPPTPRPSGIRKGQTVQGELTERDPETDDDVRYDAWSFRAREGERFALALDSDDFDPVVRVGRMARGEFTELAMNDDGGGAGLNSRLVFAAPEAGEYVIRVTPLSGAGEGDYTLKLEEGPEPAAAQSIEIGATVEGELTDTDGKSAGGQLADAYRFSGEEGQRIRIDMSSTDFDTFVELFDEDRTSLGTDDDGAAEGTNSRLIFTLPKTGTYIVEARAFSEATGDYTLAITTIEPEKAPDPIAFGAKLEGEIGEGDSRDNEDRGFDGFVFTGREGQRVQAIMRSGDFDTYLQIGKAGTEFTALATDDDGLGEGTDSRLNFILPEDGDYVLRAAPLAPTGKGLYALEFVDRGPQPQPGSLLVGSTARGTLTETDATADDNSFYDAYRVTVKDGEKLLITMVSNDVDSFVTVGRVKDDGEFESLGTDDDGLSDTHSKLEWTAPSDGTFEIRAGTFQQGQTGSYALNVEKQP